MEKKEVLINEKILQERIKQIADEITEEFQGEEITLVCILKGSLYFFADLSRRIKLDTNLEFIRVSSYEGEKSTGEINFKLKMDEPVTGKNVIVVEDIIDTGRTLSYLLDYFAKQEPKKLKLCTLLDKPERREVDNVNVDYVGFTIPNRFVIGYGLDLDQRYRNLPEINCIINDGEEKMIQDDAKEIQKQLVKKPQKKNC